MRNPLADSIAEAMAAVERRDAEQAAQSGTTVDALRRDREARIREMEQHEIREARAERIAPYRGRVTDDDFQRIVRGELDSDAARAVDRWLSAKLAFLVLRGERGTGKTVAALSAVARQGGRIVSALEVVRAWRNEHEDARALRAKLIGCGLLVLDDLGTEPDGDDSRIAMQMLINERQGGRRTLITTNLSRADIARRIDDRTVERIDHQGVWMTLKTTSYRVRRAS